MAQISQTQDQPTLAARLLPEGISWAWLGVAPFFLFALLFLILPTCYLLIGGFLVDYLIARGHDETKVRKSVLISGMLLGLAVFGAVTTTEPFWAITWITIALTGLAAAAPVAH